ncbi:MAG: hypothetical protein KDC95_03610 [Planctomycetes bacterium]|nr:hypothetical protein [Planctomycetota bacterium]
MQRVAFLSASCMVLQDASKREDAWEHDLEFEPLQRACAERGIELVTRIWDDPELVIDDFDAFVVGTTWDYQERVDEFLAMLGRVAERKPLFNPLEVVRWNLDKRYLRELDARGVRVVPTLWAEDAGDATILDAFDHFGTERLVVKPVVGAGAWRQVLVSRDAPLPPREQRPPAQAMVQPFLESVTTEGEYSFLFFDGEFSHCALKRPAAGDYRVQSLYGGREVMHEPSEHEIAACKLVLAAARERLLYARVDMVRYADELALIELEVVEPYLYPEQGPQLGERFAAALERMLG